MLNVSIVDKQPVFARGLASILEADPGLKVAESVGTLSDLAFDGGCGVAEPRRIIIVDLETVSGPAGERLLELRARRDAVVLTLVPAAAERAQRLGALGLAGYVDRLTDADGIRHAVRSVIDREFFTSPTLVADLLHPSVTTLSARESSGGELSRREYQVLQYIALGRTHDQIARRLGISRHTVDTYVKRIRGKLQLGNKAELTRAALLDVTIPHAS
jgi:DNA-binding NarL/FixJ family response regulator